ncbi:MAG: bifunctional 5,10-methylenetetrahydrofolate dehydrogenase/5,10-methenyltetrahydrofolate cyclohydrolase [Spirochaetales bacterium]
MSTILDGKSLSKNIETALIERVAALKERLLFTPKLATILVGDDESSVTYVSMKARACKRIGLESLSIKMPKETSTEELLAKIEELNKDKTVCGILLQHPTPKQIDETACFNKILESKDVDGVNTNNFGKIAMGIDAFKPATPLGIMMLLKHYNINVSGKNAVVIGRSQILGKPIASLLLNEDATVTICHSKTQALNKILKTADIVVAAVGIPNFIKSKSLKRGVIVIDAGYNAGNVGDVDPYKIDKVSSYYTPVPGGVGPMTIAALLTQTVEAAEKL